jgi:hypothetical protein
MKTVKDNITLLVALISLVGVIGAWATIPHRVSVLEQRVDSHEQNQGLIEVIEERTKLMQDDLRYLRTRVDDIAKKTP